jgi:hypothetical protein
VPESEPHRIGDVLGLQKHSRLPSSTIPFPPPQQIAGNHRARDIVLDEVVACLVLAVLVIAVFKRPSAHAGPTELRRDHEV